MTKNYDAFKVGKCFEGSKKIKDRKDKGVFYTPSHVVDYMVGEALMHLNILENPWIRIFDPACGAGFFLVRALEFMIDRYDAILSELSRKHSTLAGLESREMIGRFIVENVLFGADIDPKAVELTKQALIHVAGVECKPNIFCCDSLQDGMGASLTDWDFMDLNIQKLWNQEYDIVLGNPPYIGHKGVPQDYKKKLQLSFPDIYRDKSDVSYCFFKRGIDLLKPQGRLSFITSRYFLEGPSASGLRAYIKNSCTVEKIIDFCGSKVFEEAGVAACIITLKKEVHPHAQTEVWKIRNEPKDCQALFEKQNYDAFFVSSNTLSPQGWRLLNAHEALIFHRIEELGTHALGDLFASCQGVITGCDRAFIVDSGIVEENQIEEKLLKPWIKNSDLRKFFINPGKKLMIYADDIDSIENYPNAARYISSYKDKLENRRECKTGVRPWYQLQWGRKKENFEREKLVYPYKSKESRFAVDRVGYYCSADVYSLHFKQEYNMSFSYDYIAALLNSKLFEFYFRCYAKKLNNDMVEYYPNTVLRMRLKLDVIDGRVMEISESILNCENEEDKKNCIDALNEAVYNMYHISPHQRAYIRDSLKR